MTDRIKFRVLVGGDKDELFKIYGDKEAMKYRGSKPMENLEDARLFIENQKLVKENILTIRQGVEVVEDARLIGSSMCRFDENKIGTCEIGYSIGREYWGKGFGKEIVKHLLKTLEKNKKIRAVIAWSNKENIASIKILEANGFHRVVQNESSDNYLYRKILTLDGNS